MPRVNCTRSVNIARTPRVRQLEGMFDVPPAERSELRWEVELPLEERDWQIGLIVGPSGCGKSTLAKELFPHAVQTVFDWPADKSIVDAFPNSLGIKDVVGLLSSVGFSSPPSWLRPFRVLSNGEQFRVSIARALAEKANLTVIDEFTSVVDRTVARIGSAALARTIRRANSDANSRGQAPRRLVAVSCHYDIIDWLDPDWTYDPASDDFQWRCLRREPISLEIAKVHRQAWQLFKQHHYLNMNLNPAARCFVAFVVTKREEKREEASPARATRKIVANDEPSDLNRACLFAPLHDRNVRELHAAAFTAVLSAPDALGGYWREHRTVCLPDYQGVGIGNALSEFVASLFVATGKRYCSRTSHPAMIRHRAASKLWQMTGGIAFGRKQTGQCRAFNRSAALTRLTAGFRFIGPPNAEAARKFGLIK